MNAQNKAIFKAHKVSSPMGNGITDGITTCSCGARWRTYYSAQGLEWIPLNEQCAAHDEAMSQITNDDWGGARPGAGRKPLADEPTIDGTISLPTSLDAKAKRLGDGNRSAGIRKALESFTE